MSHTWLQSTGWLVLVILLMSSTVAVPVRADEPDGYLPGEVLVKLNQVADLPGVAADYELDPIPLDQFGSRPIYRLRLTDGAAPPDRATALVADSRVIYAEPNYLEQTPEGRRRASWATGGDEGAYRAQWAPAMIRLPEAHTVTRGAGIMVAVLDTGVDATHPALAGHLVQGYDFVDMDADPSEVGVYGQDVVYGHGTHVAGLVALAAPDAKIMPVRVLDRDGVGNLWVLAEGLAYAVDPDGDPATDDGADVINMSLGTNRPTSLLAEIVAAVTCADDDDNENDDDGENCLAGGGRGVVVVAAVGNSGGSTPEYPAAEGVAGSLAVAASTLTDTLAVFSNYGDWVSVAAPGQDVLSSVPGGGYGTWSGTSMAAPLAAGEAALVRAVYPNLSAAEAVECIVETAADIPDPVPLRIDAAAALGPDCSSGNNFTVWLPMVVRGSR